MKLKIILRIENLDKQTHKWLIDALVKSGNTLEIYNEVGVDNVALRRKLDDQAVLIKQLKKRLSDRISSLENSRNLDNFNKNTKKRKYDKRIKPARYEQKCAFCGCLFKSAVKRAKFCSNSCTSKFHYQKSKEKAKKLKKAEKLKEKPKEIPKENKSKKDSNDIVSNIKDMIDKGKLEQHIKSR